VISLCPITDIGFCLLSSSFLIRPNVGSSTLSAFQNNQTTFGFVDFLYYMFGFNFIYFCSEFYYLHLSPFFAFTCPSFSSFTRWGLHSFFLCLLFQYHIL
jgi:hypothetical protein